MLSSGGQAQRSASREFPHELVVMVVVIVAVVSFIVHEGLELKPSLSYVDGSGDLNGV